MTTVAFLVRTSTTTKPTLSERSSFWIDSTSRPLSRDQAGNIVCRGRLTVTTRNFSPVVRFRNSTWSISEFANFTQGRSATRVPSGETSGWSVTVTCWNAPFPSRTKEPKGGVTLT